jgi:hypothetical protein
MAPILSSSSSRGLELYQQPLLPPPSQQTFGSFLEETVPADCRICIAEYLTVNELSFFYRVSRALQRVFPEELAAFPDFCKHYLLSS